MDVAWKAAVNQPDTPVALTWKEPGLQNLSAPKRHGFRAGVLKDTLRYEFKAETTLDFEPNGLCCTVKFPFAQGIGRLVTTEQGTGVAFLT